MSLRLAASKFSNFTCRRHLTLSAVAFQQKVAADPIQQLFVEEVREFATKKKTTPLIEADLAAGLDKVAKQIGDGMGVDMTKFPQFNWAEPEIQDIELKEKSN